MGYSDLGCYGSEIQTPNIDSLAANGLRFRNFHNTGRCSPSRASILTGRYPHQAGVGQLDSDLGARGYRGYINRESVTIAEVLRQAGYHTSISGKWHLGRDRPNWPIDRGFDRMFSSPNGGGYYFRPFETANRPLFLDERELDLDDWEKTYNNGKPFYSTDAFTRMGIEFIDDALSQSKPFFLFLTYIAPHFPLEAHRKDVDRYLETDFTTDPPTVGKGTYEKGYEHIREFRASRQKAPGGIASALNGTKGEWSLSPTHAKAPKWKGDKDRERYMAIYAAVVDRMDQQIGLLLDKLDDPDGSPQTADSVADNTIVIFVSDNGGASSGGSAGSGSPGHPDYGPESSKVKYGLAWANASNTPFRRFKSSNHQGGVMTPLVVRWPEGISRPGNEVEAAPGHLVDIMPTLLDAAGADYPTHFGGHKIGPVEGVSLRPLFEPGGSIERKQSLFFEHEGERAMITAAVWKIVSMNNKPWELYFLPEDPQELKNLSGRENSRVKAMAGIWADWANASHVKDWPPGKLPKIGLKATVPLFSPGTLKPGQFTLTRSSRNANLNLALEFGGTAVPDKHYRSIPSLIPFKKGDGELPLEIAASSRASSDDPRSIKLTVNPRYWYLEPEDSETVWLVPPRYHQWAAEKLRNQSGADAAPEGDPDKDGALNHQEFERGTDPLDAES